jgi:hypothetical protein
LHKIWMFWNIFTLYFILLFTQLGHYCSHYNVVDPSSVVSHHRHETLFYNHQWPHGNIPEHVPFCPAAQFRRMTVPLMFLGGLIHNQQHNYEPDIAWRDTQCLIWYCYPSTITALVYEAFKKLPSLWSWICAWNEGTLQILYAWGTEEG